MIQLVLLPFQILAILLRAAAAILTAIADAIDPEDEEGGSNVDAVGFKTVEPDEYAYGPEAIGFRR